MALFTDEAATIPYIFDQISDSNLPTTLDIDVSTFAS